MWARLVVLLCSAVIATAVFAQQAYFAFPNTTDGYAPHDEDSGTLQFTVTRTGSLAGPVTVQYSAHQDTALPGVDYVDPAATLNFADQETQKTVSLTLIDNDDSDLVRPRRLVLILEFPRDGGGPPMADTMGIEIVDDEPPPPPLGLVYGDLTYVEGDGITNTYLTIGLNRASDKLIQVAFKGYDFNSVNGVTTRLGGVTFMPGETSKQAELTIYGNDTYDGSGAKPYLFTPSYVGASSLNTPEFEVLLAEDDPQPTITISDVTVIEGNCCETSKIELTLTADYPAYGAVQWTTSSGTATTIDDFCGYGVYQPAYFLNNTTATLRLLQTEPDLDIESNEQFFVNLTSATNMIIGDNSATVTIEDDDASLPSFVEDYVRIEAGHQSDLTIRFPAPAPNGTVQLFSSDSRVKVPAAIDVAKGATSVSFAADATEAAGQVVITASVPAKLGSTQLNATVDAFRDSDLRFADPRRMTYAGETWTASIRFDPPRAEDVTVALTSTSGIVAPESVVVPAGGAVEFPFTTLAAGRGRITATYGESTDSVIVDVASQQVSSFAPANGSTSGGTTVTLKGIGFSSACAASFGNVAAQTTFVDAQTLLAKTPAHVAGNVSVVVTCGLTPVTANAEFEFASGRRRRARH